MSEKKRVDMDIEQRTGQLLRQLPLRSAPPSLEQRVWAELDRLAALPWWRRSFGHWPLAARAAFLLMSAGIGALILRANFHLLLGLSPLSRVAAGFTWARAFLHVLESIAHSIPTPWVVEMCIAGLTLYGALIVLGAAAYRSLYLDRPVH